MKITQQHLFSTKITPQTGRLLIAEPFLNELYFQRAVILLVHHDKDESMGLVLNHPSDTHTHEILNDFDFSMRIYHGGPVDTQSLFYLHSFAELNEAKQLTQNLFFGGNWDELLVAMKKEKHPERRVRFFSGYAGWGAQQLLDEMSEHAWVCISKYDDATILSKPSDTLWHDSLTSQGPELATFAHFPLNISDN